MLKNITSAVLPAMIQSRSWVAFFKRDGEWAYMDFESPCMDDPKSWTDLDIQIAEQILDEDYHAAFIGMDTVKKFGLAENAAGLEWVIQYCYKNKRYMLDDYLFKAEYFRKKGKIK